MMTGNGRINGKPPVSKCYDELERENILCDIRCGEESAPHCWPCQLHTSTYLRIVRADMHTQHACVR